MSYDYSDVDVIINCSLFYSAAGFRIRVNEWDESCELLVVLRGDPGQIHQHFSGRVHVYDYEKGRVVNWRHRFPEAREITMISLIRPDENEGLPYINSYPPVIPRFWQPTHAAPDRRPELLHIANYKFIAGDEYHRQLIELIKAGRILVHGGNWQQVGIETQPLSYWAANRMLANARWCIGLMYPNQRGRTLSGRMWQAPLHGCHVISEAGTNIAGCPGVLELETYDWMSLGTVAQALGPAALLREQATDFWDTSTERLSRNLGLAWTSPSPRAVLRCRRELLSGHGQRRLEELRRRLPGPRRLVAGLRRRVGGGGPGPET